MGDDNDSPKLIKKLPKNIWSYNWSYIIGDTYLLKLTNELIRAS